MVEAEEFLPGDAVFCGFWGSPRTLSCSSPISSSDGVDGRGVSAASETVVEAGKPSFFAQDPEALLTDCAPVEWVGGFPEGFPDILASESVKSASDTRS